MGLTDDRITAGRVARSADIVDIRLFEASAKLLSLDQTEGTLSFSIEVNPVVEYDVGSEHFVLRASYVVTISSSESADEESTPEPSDESVGVIARISFDFGALYRLNLEKDEPEITQDELDAYARTAGMLCLHPYAREHVNYVTRNLGLPGLILPIFKLPFIGAPDPPAAELNADAVAP